MKKQCTRCLTVKDEADFAKNHKMRGGRFNQCHTCRGKHKIKYRRTHAEKHRAHQAVTKRLACGTIVRAPCERCGRPDSEAHHEDYSRPLDIKWLCRPHHILRHKEMRQAAQKEGGSDEC